MYLEELTTNQPNCLKRGKMPAIKSYLVLVLHLIGWESSWSFSDQSQSEVKQEYNDVKLIFVFQVSMAFKETRRMFSL